MTEDQIKHMTERFLSWRLPSNFLPDGGISYTRPNYAPEVDATPGMQDAYALRRRLWREANPSQPVEIPLVDPKGALEEIEP